MQINNAALCGHVTRVVISPDHKGMTFFGPSLCSADSGLIITAFFDKEVLGTDQNNLPADRVSLQYYDNTTNIDVMVSKQPNVFSLTITSFKVQAYMTGTFGGWVVDKNGALVKVEYGKFSVKN